MLTKTNSKELILGIDLGTEFTVFGVYRNGKPEIIPNDYGLSLTPSVVIFADEMTCIAGSQARGYSLRFRDSIISEMKRVIGLKYNEIKDSVLKYFPNGLDKDENDKVKILVNFTKNFETKTPLGRTLNTLGKTDTVVAKGDAGDITAVLSRGNSTLEEDSKKAGFYPEYICAQLLKKVKKDAENFCDRKINKAIITVPADFSNEQREYKKSRRISRFRSNSIN
jgi:molecular chaperone DnaK (HSP70)